MRERQRDSIKMHPFWCTPVKSRYMQSLHNPHTGAVDRYHAKYLPTCLNQQQETKARCSNMCAVNDFNEIFWTPSG